MTNHILTNKNTYILLMFFVLIPFSKVLSQVDTVSYKHLKLNGNVKQITDFTYLVRDSLGKIINGDFCEDISYEERWRIEKDAENRTETNITYVFDKQKRHISTITYHTPNFPYETSNFKYEDNGILSSCDISMKFSDMQILMKEIYKYNNEKLLSGIVRYRNTELFDKTAFVYDKMGHQIEKTVIDNDGTISEKNVNKYDKFNNLIYSNLFNSTRKVESVFKFDSLNNLIYSSILYPDDKFYTEIIYEYRNKLLFKQLSLTKFSNGKQQTASSFYVYKDGLLSSRTDSATNGDYLVKQEFKYSPEGDYIESIVGKNSKTERVYSKDGNLKKYKADHDEYEYVYSYDKLNNWVRLVEYKNTIPLRMRVRKLIYY